MARDGIRELSEVQRTISRDALGNQRDYRGLRQGLAMDEEFAIGNGKLFAIENGKDKYALGKLTPGLEYLGIFLYFPEGRFLHRKIAIFLKGLSAGSSPTPKEEL